MVDNCHSIPWAFWDQAVSRARGDGGSFFANGRQNENPFMAVGDLRYDAFAKSFENV